MNKICAWAVGPQKAAGKERTKSLKTVGPGKLQDYLGDSAQVINCGEASYSIDFWSTQVIQHYK